MNSELFAVQQVNYWPNKKSIIIRIKQHKTDSTKQTGIFNIKDHKTCPTVYLWKNKPRYKIITTLSTIKLAKIFWCEKV